jgi:hypothetical protein
MSRLDGNAIASQLEAVFGIDVTPRVHFRVVRRVVVRRRGGRVPARAGDGRTLVTIRGMTCVDLGGLATLEEASP